MKLNYIKFDYYIIYTNQINAKQATIRSSLK